MYNEKIDNRLLDNVRRAFYNDELYEYLVGVGDYKLILPGLSVSNTRNDMQVMIKGINLYKKKGKESNVDKYVTDQLKILVGSDDYDKIYTVFDFVNEYIYLHESKQIELSVDILSLLKDLRKGLIEHKSEFEAHKKGEFSNGMWDVIRFNSEYISEKTGHKLI